MENKQKKSLVLKIEYDSDDSISGLLDTIKSDSNSKDYRLAISEYINTTDLPSKEDVQKYTELHELLFTHLDRVSDYVASKISEVASHIIEVNFNRGLHDFGYWDSYCRFCDIDTYFVDVCYKYPDTVTIIKSYCEEIDISGTLTIDFPVARLFSPNYEDLINYDFDVIMRDIDNYTKRVELAEKEKKLLKDKNSKAERYKMYQKLKEEFEGEED